MSEFDLLVEEFERVTKLLDEVLKDLEWRKPDVEREEQLLRRLKRRAKRDPNVEWQSQAIAVRVAKSILKDRVAEAERLEKRMLELKAELEKLSPPSPAEEEQAESGEAVHEEA